MLADAGGEDNDINATHGGSIGADVFFDAIGIHLQCQACMFVALLDGSFYLADVARHARDTFHAALLVEQITHFIGRETFLFHDAQYGGGVHIARACAHHESFERRKSHRGVDALAEFDGRDAGAVADVAGDDALLGRVYAEELADAGCHEAVAGAVRAPAAYVALLIIFIGDGVHVGLGRHGLVEGGVEHEDLRQGREHLAYGFVAFQVGGAVQRSELHVLAPFVQHFRRDDPALGEAASGHDAVSGSGNLVQALDGTVLGVEQGVEHQTDALGVGGAGRLDDFRFALNLGFQEGTFQSDFFNTSGGQHGPVVHFIEFVLDGTATAVDD